MQPVLTGMACASQSLYTSAMTTYKYFEASPLDIRARAFWPIMIAVLAVALSFFVPAAQNGSLANNSSDLATTAIVLSDSAKTLGITLITTFLVIVLGTRKRLSSSYRLKEALAVIGTVIVFAGGGAMLNEHVIKKQFVSPRPNVVWLSLHPASSAAGFSTESYYAREHGDERSRFMQGAIKALGSELSDTVSGHWVTEPGYSFPSGHAYASFFTATFFLFFATTFVASRRQWLFYLLIPWAVTVSYSRVLLNAHRPLDITVGALQGVVIGILAWLCVRMIVRRLVQAEIGA